MKISEEERELLNAAKKEAPSLILSVALMLPFMVLTAAMHLLNNTFSAILMAAAGSLIIMPQKHVSCAKWSVKLPLALILFVMSLLAMGSE